VEKLRRFFEACHTTGVSTPGMVLIDEDDFAANQDDYRRIVLPLGWHLCRTIGRTQGDKIREVWEEIKSCAWFGLIGDDNIPETQFWDRRLIDALDDQNLIVSCNDGWQAPKRLANCWIMSGDLVRTAGYIFAPGMHHLFVDDMWETIGLEASCWRCLMDVVVRHNHVMIGEIADETHRGVYGDGFAAQAGPDRKKGLWAGDERAFQQWLSFERHRIVTEIKRKRPAPVDDPEAAVKATRLARAKSRSLMIATPVARHPCYQYTVSLIDTVLMLDRLGIKHCLQMIVGSSNLPRARNELCARFLASPCTDLIFIDDDMEWRANDVARLLASNQPIAGGVGRKRVDKPNTDTDVWCGEPYLGPDNDVVQDEMGFVRFRKVGTGFLKIAREAFEQIIAAHPEWKGAGHNDMPQQARDNYYRFFRFAEDERETGEDFAFCAAWHDCGGEIWIDPATYLGHVGERVYRGSISELMTPRNAAPKEAAA